MEKSDICNISAKTGEFKYYIKKVKIYLCDLQLQDKIIPFLPE